MSAALGELFSRCRAERRAALVGYLPAGYPTVEGGIEALLVMIDAGVDVVEVGFPYSDPLIDGPVIQAAAEQALRAGTRSADVLRTVEALAVTGAPILVMSYWNPIERYGVEPFARDLAAAGGVGVITPDLTPDEAEPWLAATTANGLDPVFLVAPSSTPARIARVAQVTEGFVYAASTMGVTGERSSVGSQAADLVARVRAATSTPVCVGLGVSTADQAAEIATYSDGVIVGSSFVRTLADADSPHDGRAGLRKLTAELAGGVRR